MYSLYVSDPDKVVHELWQPICYYSSVTNFRRTKLAVYELTDVRTEGRTIVLMYELTYSRIIIIIIIVIIIITAITVIFHNLT